MGIFFYQKFEIFAIFSYFSLHFCTYNVEISDGPRNPSTTQNFVRIAQGLCTSPAGIALPGGDVLRVLISSSSTADV